MTGIENYTTVILIIAIIIFIISSIFIIFRFVKENRHFDNVEFIRNVIEYTAEIEKRQRAKENRNYDNIEYIRRKMEEDEKRKRDE